MAASIGLSRHLRSRGATFIATVAGLVMAASGCEHGAPEAGPPAIAQVASLEEVAFPEAEPERVWELGVAPDVTLGGGGSPGDDFFRIVSAVRLDNGGIVVADGGSRIQHFGPGSTRTWVVEGRGDGPGEFRSIAWLQRLPGDTVLVYDDAHARISVMTMEGEYLKSLQVTGYVRVTAVGRLPDGTFLSRRDLNSDLGPLRRAETTVFLHNQEGRMLHEVVAVPGRESVVIFSIPGFPRMAPPIFRQTAITVSSRGAFIGTGDRFEVLQVSVHGDTLGWYRREHSPPALTVDDMLRWLEGTYFDGLVTRADFPQLPPTFPATRGLLVDGVGDLWVEEFRLDDSLPSNWTVFEPSGSVNAVLTLPARFSPMDVGEDFVLGVWRDELDVEHLRVYSLSRGQPYGR